VWLGIDVAACFVFAPSGGRSQRDEGLNVAGHRQRRNGLPRRHFRLGGWCRSLAPNQRVYPNGVVVWMSTVFFLFFFCCRDALRKGNRCRCAGSFVVVEATVRHYC